MAFFLAGSSILVGISRQVKLEIGIGRLSRGVGDGNAEIGRASTFRFTAAAAVTPARSAFTKAPAEFLTLP